MDATPNKHKIFKCGCYGGLLHALCHLGFAQQPALGRSCCRKEGGEGSPCSPSWWRLYLLHHQGTAEIQVPNVKLVLSGGKSALLEGTALGRKKGKMWDLGAAARCVGPEPCTRPLFQMGQISWSAARETKLPNFPLHGLSHLTDSSAERFNILLVRGETFFF